MNKKVFALSLIAILAFAVYHDVEARDGRGGGGGPRGGAGRGADINRGRGADINRGRDADINRGRAAQINRGDFNRNNIARTPSLSGAQTWNPAQRAQAGAQAASRSNLQQLARQSPGQLATLPNASSLTNRLAQQRPLNNNLGNLGTNRFNNQFWQAHNYHPNYYNARQDWARAATWGSAYGWLGWGGAAAPIYYDDGSAYSYPADQSYAQSTTNYYSDNSVNIVQPQQPQQQVATDNSDQNWLPLGLFYVASEQNTSSPPVMFFQLALGKDGSISGSYYNQGTDQVYPVEGVTDSSTQKAVWKMSTGTNPPIFETGLYNLTLPNTSVQVHFGDMVQNWIMVRMQ